MSMPHEICAYRRAVFCACKHGIICARLFASVGRRMQWRRRCIICEVGPCFNLLPLSQCVSGHRDARRLRIIAVVWLHAGIELCRVLPVMCSLSWRLSSSTKAGRRVNYPWHFSKWPRRSTRFQKVIPNAGLPSKGKPATGFPYQPCLR